MASVATDVKLINDGLGKWDGRRSIVLPVKGIDDHAAAPAQTALAQAMDRVRDAPALAAADCLRIGVEQDGLGIKPMARLRRPRTVHAVAIQDIGREALDQNMPDIAGAVVV